MALSIKGRVVELTPPVSNEYNGRTYCKQSIVLEYGEDEPSIVAFEFDPDRKADAASAKAGEEVEISFKSVSFESKKEKGVYFTTNRLFRINFLSARSTQTPTPQASAPAPTPTPNPNLEVAPQAAAPATQPALQPNMAAAEDDSLPF